MGRVLGQDSYNGWEKRVEELIATESAELEELRRANFTQAKIEKFEEKIKRLYQAFVEILGPIAAVKTMHLICPNFFPLWDNAIATAFRNERGLSCKLVAFSAEDNYGFMLDIKKLLNTNHSTISMLAWR